MKTLTSEGNHRIQWTVWMEPDDLDLADDLTLLSYAHQEMQMKPTSVSAAVCISRSQHTQGKMRILKYNTENTTYYHT
ncbi:unnamed protein product [Schistosoma margrebowiei]|uniref:Uncharacterized protein n=1 Tax=Schistosoma margrebowiei TaxID=48269 RepID=A0A183MFF0_9TREM|nr:unnamed protein product [Schistosoma margrebowiei]